MNRRLITIFFSLVALSCPVIGRAQQPTKVWKIGVLASAGAVENDARNKALRQGLNDLGYTEGRHFTIEYRYAEGKLEQLTDLANDLVRQKVDVIVVGGTQVAMAAKKATGTIPIVTAGVGDLVRVGLVKSFAYPGGNVTGVSRRSPDYVGKRIEILKQAAPKITRVAALLNQSNPSSSQTLREVEIGAQSLGLGFNSVSVRSVNEFQGAYAKAKTQADAVFVTADALFNSHMQQLVELAASNRLPAIYPRSDFVEIGGLMSYAVNLNDLSKRAAWYVDQVLKGVKPADLPMTEPTKFELVINTKTAEALGLKIPADVLGRSDRVIK
jgi:putative ABC transport system substrate-binding protein